MKQSLVQLGFASYPLPPSPTIWAPAFAGVSGFGTGDEKESSAPKPPPFHRPLILLLALSSGEVVLAST